MNREIFSIPLISVAIVAAAVSVFELMFYNGPLLSIFNRPMYFSYAAAVVLGGPILAMVIRWIWYK